MSEMSISKERLEQFKQIVFNFLNASRGHGMYANYNGNPIHRLSEFAMLLYLIKNDKLHAVANVYEDDDNVLAMHSGRGLILGDMHKEWNWKDIAHISIVKDPFIKDESLIPLFEKYRDTMRQQSGQEYLIIACEQIKKAHLESNEYESLLAYAESQINENAGKSSAVYSNPQSLADLAIGILSRQYETIYDPFMGMATFAIGLPENTRFVGTDIYSEIVEYVQIKMAISERSCDCACTNSLYQLREIDNAAIITFPPMGLPVADDPVPTLFQFFEESYYKEMILIVAPNVCFAERYSSERKILTDRNYVDKIIHLPLRYLYGTSIAPILLHLKKERSYNEPITILQAESFVSSLTTRRVEIDTKKILNVIHSHTEIVDVQKYVSPQEIADNNYLWTVNTYLEHIEIPEGFRLYSLGEVAHISGLHIPADEQLPLIKVSHLSNNPLDANFIQNSAIEKSPYLSGLTYVEGENILVSKVRTLKPSHFIAKDPKAIYINGNVVALQVDTDIISYEYLCNELSKEYVQKQVDSYQHGTGIPSISIRNLMEIKILIPCKDVQDELVRQAYRDNLSETERRLQDAYDDYQREIHTRRHALAQTVRAFSALYNPLVRYMKRNGGTISETDVFGEPNPRSVKEAFTTLSQYLRTLDNRVEHLADVVAYWGEEDNIELNAFLCEYIDSHASLAFRFDYTPKDVVLAGTPSNEVEPSLYEANPIRTISIPKNALIHVLDNIVSNACSHGFTDKSRTDYSIEMDFYYDGDIIVLEIANNGTPIQKDVDLSMVFDYGYTTALNEIDTTSSDGSVHSGIGGYDIRNILKKYHGDVEIISNPESDFPVMYRITFNNVEIPETEWKDND